MQPMLFWAMADNELADLNQDGGNKDLVIPTQWPSLEIEKADQEITRVAREIRLYYYQQLPLLRELPYLALESNGHGGWSDESNRAYSDYMLAIHQEHEVLGSYPHGSYDMFIELRTGMLIGATSSQSNYIITPNYTAEFGGHASWNLASDREVFVKLAYQSEDRRFNPIREAAYYRKHAKNPYHNDREYVESWLKEKEQIRLRIDQAMADLPIEKVVAILRSQGFDL